MKLFFQLSRFYLLEDFLVISSGQCEIILLYLGMIFSSSISVFSAIFNAHPQMHFILGFSSITLINQNMQSNIDGSQANIEEKPDIDHLEIGGLWQGSG